MSKSGREHEVSVPTPYGEGRMIHHRAAHPRLTMLLSHGAGGGAQSRDLAALADHLPAHGINVLVFEQPWRVAGRPLASPPATLDVGLRAAADQLRSRTPLVVGGRSAGARSACRTARSLGAIGCLALAFPLHPPGRPEKTRVAELAGVGLPTLVVQGTRDPFGRPEEFPAPAEEGHVELAVIPGADHGFKVPARAQVGQEAALAALVQRVEEWTRTLLG